MPYFTNLVRKCIPYSWQCFIENQACKVLMCLRSRFEITFLNFSLELPASDHSAAQIYFRYLVSRTWYHELYEQSLLHRILERNQAVYFVDGGASYGLYSLIAASHPSVLAIRAVEASPAICARLNGIVSRNHLEGKITVLNAGLASESGIPLLLTENDNSEWNKVTRTSNQQAEGSIVSTTIDEQIPFPELSPDTLIFVKMDIEGAEPDAFKGMKQLSQSPFRYAILFEFHTSLLNSKPGGALHFANFFEHFPYDELYSIDSQKGALTRLPTHEDFCREVKRRTALPFPGNVFNVLLTRGKVDGIPQESSPPLKSTI